MTHRRASATARSLTDPTAASDRASSRSLRSATRPRGRLLTACSVAAAVVIALVPTVAIADDDTTTSPQATIDTSSGRVSARQTKDPGDDVVGSAASVDGSDSAASLALVPDANGVLASGFSLGAAITVTAGDTDLDAGEVAIAVGTTAISDDTALDDWLGGSDQQTTTLRTDSIDAASAGADTTAEVTIASDDATIGSLAAGVYPLRATYSASADGVQTQLEARSAIIVTGGERSSVTVVIPITAPSPTTVGSDAPATAGLLSATQLTELTSPGGSLLRLLDAAAGTGAVLAIDPAIPAAIRALGSAAPATATEWLDRLERLPNERFALQFGDADAASQIAAGLDAPLQPTSLAAYLDDDDFQQSTTPTPDPTASSAATATDTDDEAEQETVLPTLDELLDIGDEAATVYWPVDGTVDADIATALAAGGATTIVPSTATEQGSDGTAVAARSDGVLVSDAALADAVEAAAHAEEDRSSALVGLAAQLWFAADEAGGDLLVALDRTIADTVQADNETPSSDDALGDALGVLTHSSAVTATNLTDLLQTTAQPVDLLGDSPASDRVAAVTTFTQTDSLLQPIATALADPSLLTGSARAEALQLLSVRWAGTDGWRDALDAEAALTASRLDGIGMQVSDHVNLVAVEAPLPVWVRNDLSWPVDLVLIVETDDPRLDVQDRIEVPVPAGTNPRIEIPVEARLGSGDVRLTVTLSTTTGEQIGAAQTMDVTVRADWERIGIVVFICLIAALVAGGVIRTIVRARKKRTAA